MTTLCLGVDNKSLLAIQINGNSRVPSNPSLSIQAFNKSFDFMVCVKFGVIYYVVLCIVLCVNYPGGMGYTVGTGQHKELQLVGAKDY